MQRIIIKKYFLFTVGSVYCVKRFTTGSTNYLKDVPKSQMMPDELWKWLRQQSKDFYTAGFDAMVKLWTNLSMLVDMSKNKCFSPDSPNTCFAFNIHLGPIY
jgi:hypothetical protein